MLTIIAATVAKAGELRVSQNIAAVRRLSQ
jgi:hypothetical protein